MSSIHLFILLFSKLFIFIYFQLQAIIKSKQSRNLDMKSLNKLFSRQNTKNDHIVLLALDCTMVLFILFALYALLFDELRYPFLALAIIVLYSLRVTSLVKRFLSSTPRAGEGHNYQQVHSLEELNPGKAQLKDLQQGNELDNSMLNASKKSFLVREFQRLNDSRSMSNRNANSLNRSKMQKSMRGSFQRIRSPNSSMQKAGNFIGDIFNMKNDNSVMKSRLSQSFIRTVDAKTEDQQALRQAQKKIYQKVNSLYEETLKNKLEITREEATRRYGVLKNLMADQCREVLKRNLANIQEIIKVLEENYSIKINNHRNFPQLNANGFPSYNQMRNSETLATYELEEALLELMNSGNQLPFPRRQKPHTLTSYPGTSWRDAGLVREEKVENVGTDVNTKIQKLKAERLKLDKMLHWGNDQIKIQNILAKLQSISEFAEMEGNSNHFIKQDSFNLTEDESRRKVAAMNVMKEYINSSLAAVEQHHLIYEYSSLVGWLLGKKNNSNWQLRKDDQASNYGHPHYNLINKDNGKEQILYCQFGSQNGVSVLYCYLHMLLKQNPEVVRGNLKINQLVCKVVGRGVI